MLFIAISFSRLDSEPFTLGGFYSLLASIPLFSLELRSILIWIMLKVAKKNSRNYSKAVARWIHVGIMSLFFFLWTKYFSNHFFLVKAKKNCFFTYYTQYLIFIYEDKNFKRNNTSRKWYHFLLVLFKKTRKKKTWLFSKCVYCSENNVNNSYITVVSAEKSFSK